MHAQLYKSAKKNADAQFFCPLGIMCSGQKNATVIADISGITTAFQEMNLILTMKHGSGSVMI